MKVGFIDQLSFLQKFSFTETRFQISWLTDYINSIKGCKFILLSFMQENKQ